MVPHLQLTFGSLLEMPAHSNEAAIVRNLTSNEDSLIEGGPSRRIDTGISNHFTRLMPPRTGNITNHNMMKLENPNLPKKHTNTSEKVYSGER